MHSPWCLKQFILRSVEQGCSTMFRDLRNHQKEWKYAVVVKFSDKSTQICFSNLLLVMSITRDDVNSFRANQIFSDTIHLKQPWKKTYFKT